MRTQTSRRAKLISGIKRAARSGHAQGVCPGGGCHTDRIWIVFGTAFDAVAWRQEGVEALDKGRVAIEQCGNPLDYTWGIDAVASLLVSLSDNHPSIDYPKREKNQATHA